MNTEQTSKNVFMFILLTLGFLTHAIIPETIRFTKLNRKVAYKKISSVAVGTHGWFVFLCESEKGGTIYKACLPNPVQNIQKLIECVNGDRIRCRNGLIYCMIYWISSVLVYPIEKKYSPKFVIGSIQSKKTLTEKLKMVNFSVDGTVASGKDCLLKYQKNIMKKYQ